MNAYPTRPPLDPQSCVFNDLTALFLHFSLLGALGVPPAARTIVNGPARTCPPSRVFNSLTALFLHFSVWKPGVAVPA
jgi:hypothetical protein